MYHVKSGFRSRTECEKDEALCERYRSIGIPAVAAAQRSAKTNVSHESKSDFRSQGTTANRFR